MNEIRYEASPVKKQFSEVQVLREIFKRENGKTYIKTPSGHGQEVTENEQKTAWHRNEESLIPIEADEIVTIVKVLNPVFD